MEGEAHAKVFSIFSKPFVELRPSAPARNIANGDRDGLLLADDNHQSLAARDARVEQVSLQHRVVLGQDGYDDGWILRALALVDSGGISRDQRVPLAKAVGHRAPGEAGL